MAKEIKPWMMNPIFRSKIVEVYALRVFEVLGLLYRDIRMYEDNVGGV